MNTPMPSHEDARDDDLEALLAADSELLKRYRALPQGEPGKHLDTAILGRARNAVRRPTARQRWLIPVASAASVVAAAGIGWRVQLALQQEQAAATSASSAHYEVMEVDLQSADRRRALDSAVMPPQPTRKQDALGGAASEAKDTGRVSLGEIISGPARDNDVVVEPQVVLESPAVVEPHTRTDHSEQGRAPELRQSLAQPTVDANNATPEPVSAASPAPSDTTSAASGANEKPGAFEGSGARIKRSGLEDRSEAEQSKERPSKERQSNSESLSKLGRDQNAELAPADWIERIRALISARRVAQASEEIRRFRSAYPSYRLPPDLRRYER